MVSALEGFHCICLRVIILRRVHLEPKLKKIFTTLFFPICVWVREYAIRYFGKTSVPFVTYQEEEERSDSGVVPILELLSCYACVQTSLVRCSLVA